MYTLYPGSGVTTIVLGYNKAGLRRRSLQAPQIREEEADRKDSLVVFYKVVAWMSDIIISLMVLFIPFIHSERLGAF